MPCAFGAFERYRFGDAWRCPKNQEIVIDLLLADSEYLRTVLTRRRIVPFDAMQMLILTLEDRIVLKTLANRLSGQADLENIEPTRTNSASIGTMSRDERPDSVFDERSSYRCEYHRNPFVSVNAGFGGAPGFSSSSTLKSHSPNQAGSPIL